MANRKRRAELAKETLTILEQGYYQSPNGNQINIAESIKASVEGSILYRPQDYQTLANSYSNLGGRYETEIEVVNETSFSGATRLLQEGYKNIAILNFASAKNPGGGFLGGSQAQEEALARASAMYPCIVQMTEMYTTNRANRSCLYLDYGIYSPKVCVFRDDEDVLLEQPYEVSIITMPAVNAGAVKPKERPQIAPTMKRRIRHVLWMALADDNDAIVLGAWGCGVFRNDVSHMASYFSEVIREDARFKGAFKKIVFSVLDWSKDKRYLTPFQSVFGT